MRVNYTCLIISLCAINLRFLKKNLNMMITFKTLHGGEVNRKKKIIGKMK